MALVHGAVSDETEVEVETMNADMRASFARADAAEIQRLKCQRDDLRKVLVNLRAEIMATLVLSESVMRQTAGHTHIACLLAAVRHAATVIEDTA